MVLRPFMPADLDTVAALVSESFQQLFSAQMYLALQQTWPQGQLLAVESGQLVGVLLSMRRTQITGRVLVMAIREGHRGMGIGTRLLRAFLRQCGLEGMTSVVLEVRLSNERAMQFYKRFGFHVVGPLPRYYPDGEDGVLMMRDLA